MLTGTAEPQQNMTFLREFGSINSSLQSPFRWIEIQTTGVMLDRNNLRLLRNRVGVSTISLSLSSFDSYENMKINGTPSMTLVDIPKFCGLVKEYGFNLRLSLNMTSSFEKFGLKKVFEFIKYCNADQATFRKLYSGTPNTEQGRWVKENSCSESFLNDLELHIKDKGNFIGELEYGQEQRSYDGVSYVFDSDCMAKGQKQTMKYLILRPDCRLYSKWDDKASLIF
jgi:hypothetical protein